MNRADKQLLALLLGTFAVAAAIMLCTIYDVFPKSWSRPTVCGADCQLNQQLEAMIADTERDIKEVERMQAENDAIIERLKRELQASSQPASQP